MVSRVLHPRSVPWEGQAMGGLYLPVLTDWVERSLLVIVVPSPSVGIEYVYQGLLKVVSTCICMCVCVSFCECIHVYVCVCALCV